VTSLKKVLIRLIPLLFLHPLSLPADAGIPGGVAIVLAFHIASGGDDGALPLPGSPEETVSHASEPGVYDVWAFLFTRPPLVGAWSISFGLDFEEPEGAGIDVLGWESFTDEFSPHPGWPAPGHGFFARWHRFRCLDYRNYLLEGESGWWIQPVLKLRIHVLGGDVLTVSEPEPGVVPQMVECQDEEWDFDGSQEGILVIPATFGLSLPLPPGTAHVPVEVLTWGGVKVRHGGAR
jgi:hypothetical protein